MTIILLSIFALFCRLSEAGDSIIQIFGASLTNNDTINPSIYQEAFTEPTQVIQSYGFPAENHTVVTSDGYILTIHRIPNNSQNAIPIILGHGLTCSSEELFTSSDGIYGSASSVAYILWENGFDVWMVNFRGNEYTSHQTYTRNQSQFWNFSWQESAERDLPPTIDLVLSTTGKSKVFYLGKSLGTTIGFAFFSSNMDYNDKVAAFIALGPVGYNQYSTGPETKIYPSLELLMSSMELTGSYSAFQTSGASLNMSMALCSTDDKTLCEASISILGGWDPYLHNQTRLPLVLSMCRYGSSTKMYKHLGQMFRFRAMRKFDYGWIQNLAIYNSMVPPLYNMSQIQVPVILAYGPNDGAADPLDEALLERDINTVSAAIRLANNMSTHSDTTFSLYLNQLYMNELIPKIRSLWN